VGITYVNSDYKILKAILKEDPVAITQYLNGDQSPEQLKEDGIAGLDYHYSVFKSICNRSQLLNNYTFN
jgi:hypothetical protein